MELELAGHNDSDGDEGSRSDSRPDLVTLPGAVFFAANFEILRFVAFVGQLAERADEVRRIAANALNSVRKEDEGEVSPPENEVQAQLDQYRRLMAEVALTRAVDNYLTYVGELLALVFKERPETMRSQEKVPLEFVLSFDSMEELQAAIAERRVERLAYRGMVELAAWIEETMQFQPISDCKDLKAIERLVEQRNLIVHNRSVIDRRYVQRLGTTDGEVGDLLNVQGHAVDALGLLERSVGDADGRAAVKWGLLRQALDRSASGRIAQ